MAFAMAGLRSIRAVSITRTSKGANRLSNFIGTRPNRGHSSAISSTFGPTPAPSRPRDSVFGSRGGPPKSGAFRAAIISCSRRPSTRSLRVTNDGPSRVTISPTTISNGLRTFIAELKIYSSRARLFSPSTKGLSANRSAILANKTYADSTRAKEAPTRESERQTPYGQTMSNQ